MKALVGGRRWCIESAGIWVAGRLVALVGRRCWCMALV